MNSVTLVGRVMTLPRGCACSTGGEAVFMIETGGSGESAGQHAIVMDAGVVALCGARLRKGGIVRVEGVLRSYPPGYVQAHTVLHLHGGADAGRGGRSGPMTLAENAPYGGQVAAEGLEGWLQ